MDREIDNSTLSSRPPTEDEIKSASEAAVALAGALEVDGALRFGGANGKMMALAPAIGQLLAELLGHVAKGDMVTLVPTGRLLTTQEAADLLNVSRPFLIKLLKRGELHHVMVGSHRKVPLQELLRYKAEMDNKQRDALKLIAKLGQEYDAS